jgi:type IV pilus assembly protein PilY1
MPYFGVESGTTWTYLGATQEDRAYNLIQYIRGEESGITVTANMHLRTRTIDGNVWKLGDIVHSTPVTISKPPENYHLIYGDASYQEFYDKYKDRETVVYVGGNDGMLHAFTSWQYDATSQEYTAPSDAAAGEQIGDELWAYIPHALLPHLKWFPASNYSHVYYVDLKPKIFDAKILPDGRHTDTPDGKPDWGTILLAGLNMGGKQICVEDTFDNGSGVTVTETRTFYPSYTAIDITEPRNPRLLWERTYRDLGMTTSTPAVVKVKEKWFAIFGSGITDYEGTSMQKAKAFVVDLEDGTSYPNSTFAAGTTNAWLFEFNETKAFLNSPSSIDKNLNYNVDAVYFGETYDDSGTWKGKVYKIRVPWREPGTGVYGGVSGNTNYYVDDPNDPVYPWTSSTLFDAPRPITAPVSLSIDSFDNAWIYFGTGRYIGQADKGSTDTQYLFGITDPFFNSFYDTAPTDYYQNDTLTHPALGTGDLFDADPYTITTSGEVFTGDPLTLWGTWDDNLLPAARAKDGWQRTLTTSKERCVTKPSILGGITFVPSYIPTDDECGFGGDSNLYALYYETGTAYYSAILPDPAGTTTITIGGVDYEKVNEKMSLGKGKASALGIHVGQEEGAKAFIQQSTGTVMEAQVDPALEIKSGLINWREK